MQIEDTAPSKEIMEMKLPREEEGVEQAVLIWDVLLGNRIWNSGRPWTASWWEVLFLAPAPVGRWLLAVEPPRSPGGCSQPRGTGEGAATKWACCSVLGRAALVVPVSRERPARRPLPLAASCPGLAGSAARCVLRLGRARWSGAVGARH